MANIIRVRELLDSLNSVQKSSLKKLLPSAKDIKMSELPDVKYPFSYMNQISSEDKYMILGIVTEQLLRLPLENITFDSLIELTIPLFNLDKTQISKIKKSETTEVYLQHIRETKKKLNNVLKGNPTFEESICSECKTLEGHPDIKTETQIFEIKTTTKDKPDWTYFLLQVFSYASLCNDVTEIYLILPLQELLWKYDVTKWKKRQLFLEEILKLVNKNQESNETASIVFTMFPVGSHYPKLKTLPMTVMSIPSNVRPFQIFLGGAQNTRVQISDEELTQTYQIVQTRDLKLFIHTPYVINLSQEAPEDYHINCLIRHLQYGSSIGAKGVVLHVGKALKKDPEDAMAMMTENIMKVLEYTSVECPLLLETPAGQGTEILRNFNDFIGFVLSFNDPRLRVCIDTCHVFACGEDPLEYITNCLKYPDLLRLIHYNDSAVACGDCVDLHARVGSGHIGSQKMIQIAEICNREKIPMLTE